MPAPTSAQAAVDLFQAAFAALSVIHNAPADPPDSPDDFPFVTTYVFGLPRSYSETPETFRAIWDMRVDVFVALDTMPEAIQLLLTLPEAILNAIWSTIKTNAIPIKSDQGVTGEYVNLEWNGTACIGFAFVIHGVDVTKSIT